MNKDNQTEEMRYLADKMGEAISNEYKRRVLEDERKLEAILKENGWRKASEVVEEVIKSVDEMFDRQKYSSRWVDENMEVLGSADIGYAYECWRDYIKDELKRKYIEQSDG
jgi:hypothetical protein